MKVKQLHIKSKPFVFWSIGIFLLCLFPLLAHFGFAGLLGENARSTFITVFSVCAVAGVVGAFVVCALTETFRGFRSGELVFADLVVALAIVAAIICLLLALSIVGYAFSPAIAWAIELSLWAVCLVWIVTALRRSIKKFMHTL
jgi:hypothetical protein